jgi:hypothetical protein
MRNFQPHDLAHGESEADVVRTNDEKDEKEETEQRGGIIVSP